LERVGGELLTLPGGAGRGRLGHLGGRPGFGLAGAHHEGVERDRDEQGCHGGRPQLDVAAKRCREGGCRRLSASPAEPRAAPRGAALSSAAASASTFTTPGTGPDRIGTVTSGTGSGLPAGPRSGTCARVPSVSTPRFTPWCGST